MKRLLGVAAIVILGLAALVFVPHAGLVQHWLADHTGTHIILCGSSPCVEQPYYNFWSGFGSDLGEITLLTGLLVVAKHVNCHEPGCWRLTAHKMKDPATNVEYKQCHKHHPLIPTNHAHKRFWQHSFSRAHLDEVRERVIQDASERS